MTRRGTGHEARGTLTAHVRRVVALRTERAEDGNALVEFLGAALILLIPTLYLVVTLGRVQAATFAVEGAAKEAGRALSVAADLDSGLPRAHAAVGLALSDQGFEEADPAASLAVDCSGRRCLAAGSDVTTTVSLEVTLPGIGNASWLPLAIPVSARAVTPVDEYKEDVP